MPTCHITSSHSNVAISMRKSSKSSLTRSIGQCKETTRNCLRLDERCEGIHGKQPCSNECTTSTDIHRQISTFQDPGCTGLVIDKSTDCSQDTLVHMPVYSKTASYQDLQRQINELQAQVNGLKAVFMKEVRKHAESAQKLGEELKRERVRVWALMQE